MLPLYQLSRKEIEMKKIIYITPQNAEGILPLIYACNFEKIISSML